MLARAVLAAVLLTPGLARAGDALPPSAEIEKKVARVLDGDDFHRPACGDAALVPLGAKLFFDKRLSRSKTMSCATCHDPKKAFGDGRKTARGKGGKSLARNTPSLLTARYYESPLWDGSVSTLEEAALRAVRSPDEMDLPIDELVTRVRAVREYRDAFASGVSSASIACALVAFVGSLEPPEDSPFDEYLATRKGLTPSEVRGFALFAGKANCNICHGSRDLHYDGRYMNTGLAPGPVPDLGRYALEPRPGHWGAFRVPTLRNTALTAPFMHDGRLATLRDVVEFYDRGADRTRGVDPDVKPLGLTKGEKEDLLAFLEALTSKTLAAKR